MEDRKKIILTTIIKEHIQSGMPVGSNILVQKYDLNISSATVRNIMVMLEDEGYIMQPHTSAGRVPTEEAYHWYLQELTEGEMENFTSEKLEEILTNKDEISLKEAAKTIAQISGNTVFWAFHKHNLYYTGISNLFQQPEFSQLNIIHDISGTIDRIDEIIDNIFENIDMGVSVLIGSENPFGGFCSTVFVKYKSGNNVGLLGILGPMRMDYEKNIALVNFINKKI